MNRTIAAAVVALSFVAGAGISAQQRQDERELLRALAAAPPRQQFAPDVLVRDEEGILQPGVRCATRQPSDLERELVERLAGEPPRFLPRSIGEPATVDVVFHVVRAADGRFGVSARQIRSQVRLLNSAFAEAGFTFRKARVRRYVNGEFARRCDEFDVERAFKRDNSIDPDTTLNVYTCRPGDGALGWATFPWSAPGEMQGVVALYSTLPGGSAVPYDEGDTIVHEVGHWLGLYHTFQGGCSRRGDDVDDTPAQATPTTGCPDDRDSCAQRPGSDPIHNFMDYSDDRCMNEFTPGQGRRMRDMVGAYRTGIGR